MRCFHPHSLRWIYCSGYATVRGKEQADALAREANNTAGLHLGSEGFEELAAQGQAKASRH